MYYSDQITIPYDTTQANAIIHRVRVHPGTTDHVWFGFPKGCFGLAHIQVWDKGWQVWPWIPGKSYHWEHAIIDFDDRYPMISEPCEFVVKAWNEDDTYGHTLWWAVTIEHEPLYAGTEGLVRVMQELGLLEE